MAWKKLFPEFTRVVFAVNSFESSFESFKKFRPLNVRLRISIFKD